MLLSFLAKQASAIGFAVTQGVNFYVPSEAETGEVGRAGTCANDGIM